MDDTTHPIPQAPTSPDVRERVIQGARAVLPLRKVDKTYDFEIKKYKQWVDGQRAANALTDGKYLTRNNVDLYFVEVQSDRLVTVNTGRRVVSALQHFADTVEYAGDADGFRVESSTVVRMLAIQKQKKTKHELETSKDHHVKLPVKNLTWMEKSKIVRYVLESNKIFWSDFTTTWNACNAMFCRVDTMKKMKINDIYINRNHSVGALKQDNEYPFDHQMINLILRPHIHKERSSDTHVIGAYRHRDPYMCFTGSVAMNLFVLLNTEIFNFYDCDSNIEKNIRTEKDRCKSKSYVEPNWSKTDLIRKWKSDHATRDSYTQALKACNVEWEKVTHLRKSGIEAAAAAGLDAQSIGTMSKHHTERGNSKMNNAYFTELYFPVLLWASGYDKNDIHSYNNPRTRLALPSNNIENVVFPQLPQWRLQQQSAKGDKRECTRHFLEEVLPFLAMVIVQDGIYWIKDYPNNEASRLLRSKMPPTYPNWAADARKKIHNQVKDVGIVQIDNLNATAQRAFNLMVGVEEDHHQQALKKLQQVLQQQQHQHRLLQQVVQQQALQQQQQSESHQQHQQQLQLLQQLVQQQQQQQLLQEKLQQLQHQLLLQQQQLLQGQQQQRQQQPHDFENDIVDNGDIVVDNGDAADETVANEHNIAADETVANDTIANYNTETMVAAPIPIIAAPTYQPPPARLQNYNREILPVININDVLQADPFVPFIPPALPKSLEQLVIEHHRYQLDSFVHVNKSHWRKSVQVAFSKRKNLYNYIHDKAARTRGIEDIKIKTLCLARAMDRQERGVLTVDQFATFVKNNSTTRRRRRPRLPQPPAQQQQQRINDYMPPCDGYLPQDNAGLI